MEGFSRPFIGGLKPSATLANIRQFIVDTTVVKLVGVYERLKLELRQGLSLGNKSTTGKLKAVFS